MGRINIFQVTQKNHFSSDTDNDPRTNDDQIFIYKRSHMILLSCSKLQHAYSSKRGLLLRLFSYIDRLQDSGQSNNCGEDNYYFFLTRERGNDHICSKNRLQTLLR